MPVAGASAFVLSILGIEFSLAEVAGVSVLVVGAGAVAGAGLGVLDIAGASVFVVSVLGEGAGLVLAWGLFSLLFSLGSTAVGMSRVDG